MRVSLRQVSFREVGFFVIHFPQKNKNFLLFLQGTYAKQQCSPILPSVQNRTYSECTQDLSFDSIQTVTLGAPRQVASSLSTVAVSLTREIQTGINCITQMIEHKAGWNR